MNKNIKLAVAGAILATASVANAGILIPAGDWTLDVGGNVNAYTSWSKLNDSNNATIRTTFGAGTGSVATRTATNSPGSNFGFGNGLLPNFLSVGGTTRQNDLDVSFVISIQPGSTATNALNGGTGAVGGMATGNGGINNRQSFITFGDKSWGSVKIGKDLGIFASDAILSDMTLLGVGAGAAGGGNTSLGRIGYGYIYADWKPQLSYTTPNMSGFQATAGISTPFTAGSVVGGTTAAALTTASKNNASPAYEGKASYSFSANDLAGKIWVSGIAQRQASFGGAGNDDSTAYAADIGANVNMAGFGLTGYYYGGSGIGSQGQMTDGYGYTTAATGASGIVAARDSSGGYIQATYTLPTKTKLGVSWGISELDKASGETALTTDVATSVGTVLKENKMWTLGVYHPLTKHLNLVAEYNDTRSENQAGQENKMRSANLGAILFF